MGKCQYQPLSIEDQDNENCVNSNGPSGNGNDRNERSSTVLKRYSSRFSSINQYCIIQKEIVWTLLLICLVLATYAIFSIVGSLDEDYKSAVGDTLVLFSDDGWSLAFAEQVDFRGNVSLMSDCIVGKYGYVHSKTRRRALVGSYLCDLIDDNGTSSDYDELYRGMVSSLGENAEAVYETTILGSRNASIMDVQPMSSMVWPFMAVWQEQKADVDKQLFTKKSLVWTFKYNCIVEDCTKEEFEDVIRASLQKVSFQRVGFPAETLTQKEANQVASELLQGMPLPDSFKKPLVTTQIILRYHLNAILCNAVGRAWLTSIQDSIRNMDETSTNRARDALSTYTDWPIFKGMIAVDDSDCVGAFQEIIDQVLAREKLTVYDLDIDSISSNWCLNAVYWS